MKKAIYLWSLLMAAPGLSHGATVFYEETFPHPSGTGGNVSHSVVGWQFHDSASATDQSTATGSYAVSDKNGVGGNSGYGAAATSSTIAMAWTNEFTSLDRSLTEITSISFASNNAEATPTMRVAIRLDNAWYASSTTFTNPAGGTAFNFEANAALSAHQHSLPFSTAGTDWHLLTFTAGSTLSRNSSTLGADLPGDNLTAAGILYEDSTGNIDGTIRYDNFTINRVPEPSALIIASLGALVGLRRRR